MAQPKLTPEQFVNLALTNLRDPRYKGIHTVFSGFNQAFREYYEEEGLDPVATVKQLADEEKFIVRPARGGARIFRKDEVPTMPVTGSGALKKMGLPTKSGKDKT